MQGQVGQMGQPSLACPYVLRDFNGFGNREMGGVRVIPETIDDENGDITYQTANRWRDGGTIRKVNGAGTPPRIDAESRGGDRSMRNGKRSEGYIPQLKRAGDLMGLGTNIGGVSMLDIEGVIKGLVKAGKGVGVGIKRNPIAVLDRIGSEVIKTGDVIGMAVGIEDSIQSGNSCPKCLGAKIGGGIDHDAKVVVLQPDRGSKASIPRIGGATYAAMTGKHGNALRGSGPEKSKAHEEDWLLGEKGSSGIPPHPWDGMKAVRWHNPGVMLKRLRIKNLAVIEELEWELGQGFNVLTGETGAGKSILVDAFLLLLGERADRGLIRTGAEGCWVEGELGGAGKFKDWLEEKGVEADPEGVLVIKRQIGGTGAGRQFLNGSSVTLAVLKELGDRLVDLHGPHDHQTLLSPATQRGALDGFGGLEQIVEEVRQAWRGKKVAEEKREAFQRSLAGVDGATRELIDHQVKELESAQLRLGEDEELERDHAAAGHGRRIIELAAEVSGQLESGEENALQILGKVQKGLVEWERLDGAASSLREKNEAAVELLREIVREGEHRAGQVGLDGERLAELEARLNLVLGLRKKYGGTIEAALRKLGELKKRQAELADSEGTERELMKEVERANEKHLQLCTRLGKERKKIAPKFSSEVTEQLRGLGFKQSRLEVSLEKLEIPGAEGGETLELMFAPNPGEPPRPLRAIASSGELARVMLGIKTVLAERDEVPILIFDEVDANVGGETALAVASRLAKLGRTHQVLCLTHLPAVAGVADAHFCVTKTVEKGRTFARLEKVEGENREKELRRMLGGEGEEARAMAREFMGKRGKSRT